MAAVSEKLRILARRAEKIKTDPALRHFPNEHDLRVAAEHARDMACPQYMAIAPDKEDK